jgi:hypothetical protein
MAYFVNTIDEEKMVYNIVVNVIKLFLHCP